MQKKDNKNSMFEMCPVRNVIARFGNKWGFLVLLDINEHGTIRFNELHRVIPRCARSKRMTSSSAKFIRRFLLVWSTASRRWARNWCLLCRN